MPSGIRTRTSGIMVPAFVATTSPPAGPTTFVSSPIGAHITLSNGNLTATSEAGAGANDNARSNNGHNSGKYFFEVTFTNDANPATGKGIGLINANFTVGAQGFGADAGSNSIRYNSGDGFTYIAGANVLSNFVYTTLATIGVAVDFTNHKVWLRADGANWNNDAAADPANNINGFDLSATVMAGGVTVYAGIGLDGEAGDIMTARFLPPYNFAQPAGFGDW